MMMKQQQQSRRRNSCTLVELAKVPATMSACLVLLLMFVTNGNRLLVEGSSASYSATENGAGAFIMAGLNSRVSSLLYGETIVDESFSSARRRQRHGSHVGGLVGGRNRGLKEERNKEGRRCAFEKSTEMTFDDLADSDAFEGTFSKFGERNFWHDDPLLLTSTGDQVGTASGTCTVIAEADETGFATYLCTLTYEWTSGNLEGSTLVAEGLYRGGSVDGIASGNGQYTVTGGTGCFAGESGSISQTALPDPGNSSGGMIFRMKISVE